MKKQVILSVFSVWFAAQLFGQEVPKAVLVEHFTNTRCSVCASRNPGFYANLASQDDATLHIAYHPSAPYSNCTFSAQNPEENDNRTNFYEIYGSTPRLVINGNVVSASQNYGAASIFTPYLAQTSPYTVAVNLTSTDIDSITATVQITTEVVNNLTGLTLYIPLAQDEVAYNAPNGESTHYDVFRKSFTGNNPISVTPSTTVGGVITVAKTVFKNPNWIPTDLYALAILQDADKQLVQADASPLFTNQVISATEAAAAQGLSVYPNPAQGVLTISGIDVSGIRGIVITNSLGQSFVQQIANTIQIGDLPSGVYSLHIKTQVGHHLIAKFIKA